MFSFEYPPRHLSYSFYSLHKFCRSWVHIWLPVPWDGTLLTRSHIHCKMQYTVGSHGTRYLDDVIKWKHFPRYWSFVRGIHRSPLNSPHKGQWRGALMFSLIWGWISDWVNNRKAGDLRRHRAHYDVTGNESYAHCSGFVMLCWGIELVDVPHLQNISPMNCAHSFFFQCFISLFIIGLIHQFNNIYRCHINCTQDILYIYTGM